MKREKRAGWVLWVAGGLLVAMAVCGWVWGVPWWRARQMNALAATGLWQPQIHFYAGPKWMNDPNGPIWLNGQYNTFFQYNPFGDEWGHMSWGHAVSNDLLHWKQLPVALAEENGVMIFSGSTVVDRRNTSGLCGAAGAETPNCVVAIYTGYAHENHDRQNQNVAYSRDGGLTWTKYSGNPVVELGLKDFRDPKVFWHEPSQSWVMVTVLSDLHKARIWRSKDLIHWAQGSDFGPTGATGGVWECPDLFELPVFDEQGQPEGTRWVLSVNLNPGGPFGGSADQYFVGQFDGTRFVEDRPGSGPRWADWGKDFYASTSFSNLPAEQGRVWIAWMNNWQYAGLGPNLPGRGGLTLARRLSLHRLEDGSMALAQQPVLPEQVRPYPGSNPAGEETIAAANQRLAGEHADGSVYELKLTLVPGGKGNGEIEVLLRTSGEKPGEAMRQVTVVGVDSGKGEIFVDRTRSGMTAFSKDFPVRVAAPLKHPHAKEIPLQIVVDRNSVEVFAEDGETVLTNLIYPDVASTGLALFGKNDNKEEAEPMVKGVAFVRLGPTGAQ